VAAAVAKFWGYSELKPLQAEAIQAGIESADSLVVLPTGGGKSLCYQVPPVVSGRLDVVVSPLIALMKDQVDALRACGYAAAAIHSNLGEDERRRISADLVAGRSAS
jgi:ATP-dependent DNA helicase RecQ